jgi:hypothetical protein
LETHSIDRLKMVKRVKRMTCTKISKFYQTFNHCELIGFIEFVGLLGFFESIGLIRSIELIGLRSCRSAVWNERQPSLVK